VIRPEVLQLVSLGPLPSSKSSISQIKEWQDALTLGLFHARAGRMPGMEENPYQSPEEVGYDNPLVAAARAWRKDRMMLIGCGLLVAFVFNAVGLFGYWILYLFGLVPP
jgi:hypothetical protein